MVRLSQRLPVFFLACLAVGFLARGDLTAMAQDNSAATLQNSTALQADEMNYDDATDTLKAIGRVEIERDGRMLRADTVTYNQVSDVAVATGNVSLLDKNGTVMFFDRLEMKGDLKDGFAREVRVILADKSHLTSREFRRTDGHLNEMRQAVYTACDECKGRAPVWQIKASNVRYDSDAEMVYYNNARIELGGVPVFYTPYLAHPDPSSGRKSGLLLPVISGGRNLGLSYAQPYYINIAPDKDATLSPLITTSAGKGMTAEYRQRFARGELQLFGSVVGDDNDSTQDVRGHLRGRARWDIDDKWRSGADVQLASDDTYLRRYNFDAPTWLTTNAYAERFSTHSYFSANTYYFQRQRRTVAAGTTPIIAPLLQYNYVGDQTGRGGYFTADANALVLYRDDGSDSNRISTKVGWNLPYTSPLGDIYTLRATLRGDGYYVRDVLRPTRKDKFTGTTGRVLPEASLEWRFPFVRNDGNAHQLLEPIIMGAISPKADNPEEIPNEDSRDLEFDDTNLFDTQRVTGRDRVEGGARVNYGLRWSLYGARGGSVSSFVGQSYRFNNDKTFTPITGLDGKLSDIVGRIDAAPNPYLNLLYRFRVNKDTLGSRRNEFGLALGPEIARLGVSYIFLKQDPTNPTLGEREELFTSFSTRLTKYWSLSASNRQDLSPNGGRIRTAFGFTYEDECSVFGIDLADDNTSDRDFKRGLTVLLRFNLKTIGDIKFNTGVGAQK